MEVNINTFTGILIHNAL